MLNSNFDLRKFLAESKNPTLNESSRDQFIVVSAEDFPQVKKQFEEMIDPTLITLTTSEDQEGVRINFKFRPTDDWEALESPTETMYDIIEDLEDKGIKIVTSSVDASQFLSEATVMEYIRERMSSMNNEVRSCMREYLERCNEIDMEHEDAHAQLMNALEDFYNKLKAHFEEDEADMEEPLATSTDSPQIPVEEDQDFTKTPDEREEDEKERFDSYYTGDEDDESFGSDKDAVNEGFLDRLKKKPAQAQPTPAKVLSADEIQAMIDKEAKTNTVGDILDAATVQGTIDLRNATPEQIKMFVSIARDSDHEHDTITGDNYIDYLESLPNYKGVAEANFDPRLEKGDQVHTATPDNKLKEDHSANPNDKYVVRPCKNKKEPWAVWEGEVRVKGFATKEEAQEFADKKNKEQGLNEGDYEPRTKEDLVYQYLRDAWQLGAMKGKDVNPDEELSTMADSLLANLPDYDSAEKVEKPKEKSAFEKRLEKLAAAEKERRVNLKEETLNEDAGMYQPIVDGIMNLTNNKETALLIAGLVKTAVNVGTIPALAAALYVHKDKPLVRKVLDLPVMRKAIDFVKDED